ncbi:MAG TPA: hypothetical protein VES20_07620 [Bryobacteraceae bacterium]|nr:hypothetical protein [Bryobacteraceae bacterium]
MAAPVANPSVFQLTGNSFVWEQQKRDYARARHAAETALQAVLQAGTPHAVATAWLDLAGVANLQADCAEALAICANARQNIGSEPILNLKATAIEMWSATTRWNYYRLGAGADGLEAWARWSGLA